jgi:tetratricopeptide (TPR) repeat protein
LIEYGSPPDEGRRFVEGALRVVKREDAADRNFELFCLQLLAVHDRLTGRFAEARKGLSEALQTATSRGFKGRLPSLLLDDGRTLMEMGEYAQAGETFEKARASAGGTATPELLIEQARLGLRLGDFAAASAALDQASLSAGAIEAALAPRLETTRAEVAYAQGRVKDARAAFERASKLWSGPLPDAASVEARAFAGFLDALDGREQGRRAMVESLRQAAGMKRPAAEAVVRLLLARLDLRARRPAEALETLAAVQGEALSPEVRALVHYWRAEARDAQMPGSGADDRREAGRWFEEARQRVPSELRERYSSRPDLQVLVGHAK